METIEINKEAINDLIRLKDDFDSIIESLELMSNKEFMKSYKKSREEDDILRTLKCAVSMM